MFAEIVSLNVGKPVRTAYGGKEVKTAIFKQPVAGTVHLSTLNFEGDAQGDTVHHGGPDKAVCVYAVEHYPHWEPLLGRKFLPGAFGENLTTRGIVEDQVCIGDIFRLGGAVVQVSQPRQPCYKLSLRHGWKELPRLLEETGYTGYYLRVLKEGTVAPGDRLLLESRHPRAYTVQEANRIMHGDKHNAEAIQSLIAVEALSANWRTTLRKRLDRLGNGQSPMA
jgi:MOSC domain-containing protein YiiM